MAAIYRVSCVDHDQLADVPDYDSAVDWQAGHQQNYPGHRVDCEPHDIPVVVFLDPASIKAGEF